MNPMVPDAQVIDFLSRPLVSRLAVNTPEGYPHVTPVWYLYDQGRFYLSTETDRHKFRLLQRDPRATLLIDEADQGRMIMVHGEVTVWTGDPEPLVRRITARYIPVYELDDTVRWLLSGPRVVLELAPHTLIRFGSGWQT